MLIHFSLIFTSQFIQSADLIVGTPLLPVTRADLTAEQVNLIAPVTINEKFDVEIALIDRLTRQRLEKARWDNWYWSYNVTLYTLPKFNQAGLLNLLNSSISINTVQGIIKLVNLQINAVGMYMLNIQLVSTNGEYSINLRSKSILIYKDKGKSK